MSSHRTALFLNIALLVVSLVVTFIGIAQLTFLRPSPTVTFTSAPAKSATVVSGENVLESTGDSVHVSAIVPSGQEVFVGIALTGDAMAFVKSVPHAEITDFSSNGELVKKEIDPKKEASAAGEQPAAKGSPAPAKSPQASPQPSDQKKPAAKPEEKTPAPSQTKKPDPELQKLAAPEQADVANIKTLDIWKQSATGKTTAALDWQLSDSRWSAVAVLLNPPEGKVTGPKLQLKWQHEPSLTPPIVMIILGGLAAVSIGVFLALLLLSERRSRARRLDAMEKDRARELAAKVTTAVTGAAPVSTDTGVVPVVHPTRRSLRLAQDSEPKSRRGKKSQAKEDVWSQTDPDATGQIPKPGETDGKPHDKTIEENTGEGKRDA